MQELDQRYTVCFEGRPYELELFPLIRFLSTFDTGHRVYHRPSASGRLVEPVVFRVSEQ